VLVAVILAHVVVVTLLIGGSHLPEATFVPLR
jgi:hypothetical protein